MNNTTRSEVADLMRVIEQEHQACVWALNGLAEGAIRHDFIQRRLTHMGIAHESLVPLVGPQQAAEVLCDVFERSPSQQERAELREQWQQEKERPA